MLIKLGSIELCRGKVFSEIPIDFKINGERKIQKISRIRAKNILISDRGNLSNEITFKVMRKHASHEEASQYALLHSSAFDSYESVCRFISEKSGMQIILQQCAIISIQCQIIGTSTLVFYHLIGSALKLFKTNHNEK